MSAVRVLHVDDEPDIREVVEISLGLDPNFSVRGCASGKDALAAAADWSPNLILLDVMMPGMDGPATLGHLRDNPRTAAIPVVFMTARAQPRELEQFVALGAEGVIPLSDALGMSHSTSLSGAQRTFRWHRRLDANDPRQASGHACSSASSDFNIVENVIVVDTGAYASTIQFAFALYPTRHAACP